MGNSNESNYVNDPYLNNPQNQEQLRNLYSSTTIEPPSESNRNQQARELKTTNTIPINIDIILKRDSLKLVKDSIHKNNHYLTFRYQTFSDIKLETYFNAKVDYSIKSSDSCNIISKFPVMKKNISSTHINPKKQNDKISNITNISNVTNNIQYSNFNNSSNHHNNYSKENNDSLSNNYEDYKEFMEKEVCIDLVSYFQNKSYNAELCDVILKFTSYKNNDITTETEIYVFFKLIIMNNTGATVKEYDVNDCDLKIMLKFSFQKIRSGETWYNMHDVYGLSSKNEEDGLCEICYSDKKNAVFIPCMHNYACRFCSIKIRECDPRCPICRKEILDSVVINTDNNTENKDKKD